MTPIEYLRLVNVDMTANEIAAAIDMSIDEVKRQLEESLSKVEDSEVGAYYDIDVLTGPLYYYAFNERLNRT